MGRKELPYVVWRSWCRVCGVVHGAFPWKSTEPYQQTRCPICGCKEWLLPQPIGRAMNRCDWVPGKVRKFGRNYPKGKPAHLHRKNTKQAEGGTT